MHKNKYLIAGTILEITGALPSETCCDMEKYLLRESTYESEDSVKINCEIAQSISAKDLETLYGVRNFIEEFGFFNGKYISQDRTGDKSLATLTYDTDFKSVNCALVDVEAAGGGCLDNRMRVAIGECYKNCLPAFGGITFHSSAIAYNGEALLFAAPSGTGKSTQTGLWKKYYPDKVRYINDDTPIIKRKNGVFHAFGSPWAGTSGINNNISAPIKAIIYVERGTENMIRPLEDQEKILRALRSAREQRFPVQRERQTELIFDIMAEIPVYELSCNISREAVETVKSLLFQL